MSQTAATICTWTGRSGRTYDYKIYPVGTPFKALPANYVFAKEMAPLRWTAVYIGQTVAGNLPGFGIYQISN